MAAEGGLRGKGAAFRADCPSCDRSIAVTWNKITGEAYLRPHVRRPGVWCVRPSQSVSVSRNAIR